MTGVGWDTDGADEVGRTLGKGTPVTEWGLGGAEEDADVEGLRATDV